MGWVVGKVRPRCVLSCRHAGRRHKARFGMGWRRSGLFRRFVQLRQCFVEEVFTGWLFGLNKWFGGLIRNICRWRGWRDRGGWIVGKVRPRCVLVADMLVEGTKLGLVCPSALSASRNASTISTLVSNRSSQFSWVALRRTSCSDAGSKPNFNLPCRWASRTSHRDPSLTGSVPVRRW